MPNHRNIYKQPRTDKRLAAEGLIPVGTRVVSWQGKYGTVIEAKIRRGLKPYTVRGDDGRERYYHDGQIQPV